MGSPPVPLASPRVGLPLSPRESIPPHVDLSFAHKSIAAKVTAHIYELEYDGPVLRRLSSVLGSLGAGAFHVGVEVFGREWMYGCVVEDGEVPFPSQDTGSGISFCTPK